MRKTSIALAFAVLMAAAAPAGASAVQSQQPRSRTEIQLRVPKSAPPRPVAKVSKQRAKAAFFGILEAIGGAIAKGQK